MGQIQIMEELKLSLSQMQKVSYEEGRNAEIQDCEQTIKILQEQSGAIKTHKLDQPDAMTRTDSLKFADDFEQKMSASMEDASPDTTGVVEIEIPHVDPADAQAMQDQVKELQNQAAQDEAAAASFRMVAQTLPDAAQRDFFEKQAAEKDASARTKR